MFGKLFYAVFIPTVLILTALLVIGYARGYRLNIEESGFEPTGILVATSDPDGAQILINDEFSGATNSTIDLAPGWYEVTVSKEGYHDWKRRLRIQGEVVVKTDAMLFLKSPSLSPLTATGGEDPILSPDGTEIAYIASPSARVREGQSLFESSLRTPTLFIYDFSARNLPFSKNPRPYEGTRTQLLTEWATERTIMRDIALSHLPTTFQNIATDSVRILSFAPDETKVLYEATASAELEHAIVPALIGTRVVEEERILTAGTIYVYDAKEDRNYNISNFLSEAVIAALRTTEETDSTLVVTDAVSTDEYPTKQLPVFWLGTSKHLTVVSDSTISIMEYDGGNELTVYSGPFENGFVFPHPSGNQLIIMTNLNPEISTAPSLYTLNIR